MKAQLCWFKGRIISSLELLYVIGSSFYRLHFLGSWVSWLFPWVQVRGSTGRKLEWKRKARVFVLLSLFLGHLQHSCIFIMIPRSFSVMHQQQVLPLFGPYSSVYPGGIFRSTCTHLLSASLHLRFEQARGVGDGHGGWRAPGWTWPSWRKGRPKVPRSDL